MTRLSVCGLGVSCNEMNDTPMLLVVTLSKHIRQRILLINEPEPEPVPIVDCVKCFGKV